jgi:ATP-dependent RNA helicase DDX42
MSRNFNFTPFNYGSGGRKPQQQQQKSTGFNAVPPPAALSDPRSVSNRGKASYTSMDAISHSVVTPTSYGSRKRSTVRLDDEDYFNDDDQNDDNNLAYIPAANSPAAQNNDDSDEEDPLDAFMAGLEKEQKVEKEKKEKFPQTSESSSSSKGVRADIDDLDDEESYYKYMEENPMAGLADENSEDEMEYDEDGNPIVTRKRTIDPLPPIDHSEIEYEPFEKNFYQPHEEIAKLTKVQKDELRMKLGIKVMGAAAPAPVCSFAHFGFDEQLMKVIRKSEYVSPTPIQAQAIPAALSGRDIIGIAKTGSGKTAAFLWPLMVHIMDQKPLQPGDGIIGLILAPTRELSIQIYNEAKKFGKAYNIEVVCCYGGGNKYEQSKALAAGAEICVATPGRMIDMIKLKATNLLRCSYLVLDEADKMFNMVRYSFLADFNFINIYFKNL